MALVAVLKGAFTSGELSPRMAARQDIDRYKNGAIQLENWIVLPQGGVTRRSGLRFVAAAKASSRLCLVRAFEPSTTDAYILEVGHAYIRFFKNTARMEVAGVPVEVTTPYEETDLRLVRTAQSNDVMIFVHPRYAPRRLSRLSDTEWVFSLLAFDPPPLYEAGETPAVALTLSALTGSAITITAAAPYFLTADVQRGLTSGVGRAVLTAFTSSTVMTATVLEAFTSLTLPAGTWTLRGSPVASLETSVAGPAGALTTLSLTGGGTNLMPDPTLDNPAAWTDVSTGGAGQTGVVTGGQGVLEMDPAGVGGPTDYPALQTTVSGLLVGQVYLLTFDNLAVGNDRSALGIRVGSTPTGNEMRGLTYYNVGYGIQHTFTATAATAYLTFVGPTTTGATTVRGAFDTVALYPATMNGWRSTDVGKYVRAGDAYVQVTAFTNGQAITGRIVSPFPDRTPTPAGAWTLESPAWSDALGWPSAVVLYEGRLFFAGTTRFPQTIWGSAVDDLFNFALGTTAASAVSFSLVDSGGNITLNRIRWLMPAENMLVGTTHGEYRLIGAGDDPLSALTPPRNRIQSTFGSDTVQPLKVGSALLFAQRQGSKIREMTFDERTTTTFVARDITVTSEHLLAHHRVLELAYQQEPLSIIWAVRSDGVLLGLTFDQSEQIVAWWRVTTPGVVESVATIPHPTANAHQTWVSVQRTVNGQPVRYLEVLDSESRMVLPQPVPMFNELTQETEDVDGWEGLTVDSGVVYSGAPTDSLSGLGHLEGETVQIVGDGTVLAPQVVTGGQVGLSQTVSTAFVGLPYVCRGRTMPVEVPVRGLTGQGTRKRWVNLRARVQGTACLVLHGEAIPFRQPHMPQNQGVAPFTGDREVMALGYDRFGMVSFVVDKPLPATVLGVLGVLDTEVQS
jgi:hypothetical protein